MHRYPPFTWSELLFIVLLVFVGMSIWKLVEDDILDAYRSNEPYEANYRATTQLPYYEARLNQAQEQLTVSLAELTKQNIAIQRQRAIVDALATTYPNLPPFPTIVSTITATIEPDVLELHRDAMREYVIAQQMVDQLNTTVAQLTTTEIPVRSDRVATANRLMRSQYESAISEFQQTRTIATAWYSIAYTTGLLAVLMLMSWRLQSIRQFGIRPRTIICVFAILTLLYAYEALGIVGAALVAVLLFIMLLCILPRPIIP